jgi:hypothetical protein
MATNYTLGPALLAAFLIGPLSATSSCSGGAEDGGAGQTAEAEFSGEWQGTWSSSNPGPSGSLTLRLEQIGTILTGMASFEGHSCFATSSVECQVKGEGISGWFHVGPIQMAVHGSCSGPHHGSGPHHASILTGTYDILGGPCAGEQGTMQLMPVVAGGASAPEIGGIYVGEVILIESGERGVVRIPVIQRLEPRP